MGSPVPVLPFRQPSRLAGKSPSRCPRRLEEGAAADALRCYARALDLDGSSLSLWRKSTMAALHSANLPFARAAADGALRLGRSHLRTLEFVAGEGRGM